MNINKRIIFFVVSAILYTSLAYACECSWISLADALKGADAVFKGSVKEISYSGKKNSFNEKEIIVIFNVTRQWKGNVENQFILETVHNEVSCDGYIFEKGKEYLIFAKQNNNSGFGTSFCDGTRPLPSAEDIKELGPGNIPSPQLERPFLIFILC